jgi:alkylation response protein AidB-like acyl-CoA dehydrogenase
MGVFHEKPGDLHGLLEDPMFQSRSETRARSLDRASGLPPIDDLDEIVNAGFLAAPLPHALGGLGWGTQPGGAADLFRALRLMGRVSLPLGEIYENHVHAVRLAIRYGGEIERRFVQRAAIGGQLFGVWQTDLPGSALTFVGRSFAGGKTLCTGTGIVEQAIVTAKSPPGGPQQMFLVPIERFSSRGDVSGWDPSGMRASARGSIDLSGIPLSACHKIGGPDDFIGEPDYSAGHWRVLAVQLGGLEAVAEALRQHLLNVGQGRDAYQASRFGVALAAAETARLWVRQACLSAEGLGADLDDVVTYVDLARGVIERAALDVIEVANSAMGSQLLMPSSPIERRLRDLATYLRQPSADEALIAAAFAGLGCEARVGDIWR